MIARPSAGDDYPAQGTDHRPVTGLSRLSQQRHVVSNHPRDNVETTAKLAGTTAGHSHETMRFWRVWSSRKRAWTVGSRLPRSIRPRLGQRCFQQRAQGPVALSPEPALVAGDPHELRQQFVRSALVASPSRSWASQAISTCI